MLLDPTRIPRLETARLVLRGFGAGDVAPFAAMMADPRVGAPKGFERGASPEQAWLGMANILGHWALRGFGLFAVEARETRAFAGAVGVIQPPGWPEPELTWTIAAGLWGRGYAPEAAAAARDWTFGALNVPRLVSYVPASNAASARVAEKIGAVREGETRVHGETAAVSASRRAAADSRPGAARS